MKRPIAALALVFAGLCGAPAAYARTPTNAEIAQVQELLGFTPATTLSVIKLSFGRQPEFARYSVGQQTCFIDALRPEVEKELRDSFKTLFVDSETVAAWLRFGKTPGGDRFTGLMRSGVEAKLKGSAMPNPLEAIGEMSDAERADVTAFMESPAAAVLKKDFPEWKIPPGAGKDAARRCGVE